MKKHKINTYNVFTMARKRRNKLHKKYKTMETPIKKSIEKLKKNQDHGLKNL